jgi:phospholipid transport system substrate-binding protein
MQFASRRAVLCLAVAALATPAQAADGPAAALVEKVASEVIALIKSKTGRDREAGIRTILVTYFDLPYMGQSALGTHWAAATPAQRERFGQYGGQTLAVGRVSTRSNGATMVDSKLSQSNGQPIAVQWEIRETGKGPRITDVKIEGVSMVMTRRSDYNSYIQNHGGKVEPLIEELEKRAAN